MFFYNNSSYSELWLVEAVEWHSIRGVQMIILMKIVSVGYDMDSGTLQSHPDLLEIIGYLLNPGTVVFGPWISLGTYRAALKTFNWVRILLYLKKLLDENYPVHSLIEYQTKYQYGTLMIVP